MPRGGDKPIVNQRDARILVNVTNGRGTGAMVDGRAFGLIATGSRATDVPVQAG